MKYSAVLAITGDESKELLNALKERSSEVGRSEMKTEFLSNELRVTINALDPASIRAALNSILSAATIIEKMKKVK
jgi:tRNA threonylcarbamoyladenosine modification (KEOPS) complex  Pcc1 subunit